MPINETLSTYSDWLYTTAAAIYVVALMMTLIEQGFGAKGRLATERAKLRARELVGAGGPPIEEVQAAQRSAGRPERIGKMGASLLVLGFAISMFLGLGASLLVKRRRLWVRVKPGTEDDPGTVIEVAGLARTDQAGYGEEFHRISERLISGQKG